MRSYGASRDISLPGWTWRKGSGTPWVCQESRTFVWSLLPCERTDQIALLKFVSLDRRVCCRTHVRYWWTAPLARPRDPGDPAAFGFRFVGCRHLVAQVAHLSSILEIRLLLHLAAVPFPASGAVPGQSSTWKSGTGCQSPRSPTASLQVNMIESPASSCLTVHGPRARAQARPVRHRVPRGHTARLSSIFYKFRESY